MAKRINTRLSGHGARAAVPRYDGEARVRGRLPRYAEPWIPPVSQFLVGPRAYEDEPPRHEVQAYLDGRMWVASRRTCLLFTDIHADTDALFTSLVASGGVRKTGDGDEDFELTAIGRRASFVFAGDFFDKGPSTLRLLRAIRRLIDAGADVHLLVGNHDLRTYIGIACMGEKDPRMAHLFVRMGRKTVPLFHEVARERLSGDLQASNSETEAAAAERLFPDTSWFEDFPGVAEGWVPPSKIERELQRIREKSEDFRNRSEELGMSLSTIERAAREMRKMFLHPRGEFGWLFSRMQLAYRWGSVLMLHAGLDDTLADLFWHGGVDALNHRFRSMMRAREYFEIYHGEVGNAFRTKYRPTDRPFTARGVRALQARGVYAIAHGHRNILRGQRMVFRNGMLNFECDTTVDSHTRASTGHEHAGGSVTIFRDDGRVLGVSTDHPAVKVFDPAEFCTTTIT